jgi:hypothetical protein
MYLVCADATLCFLAQVDPTDAGQNPAPSLPQPFAEGSFPIDSINLWPWLMSSSKSSGGGGSGGNDEDRSSNRGRGSARNSTSPRQQLVLGKMTGGSLIAAGGWKIILGKQSPDWWYGPYAPNCTDGNGGHPDNCDDGCLFNIDNDPSEHVNLKAAQPARFAQLKALLDAETSAVGLQRPLTAAGPEGYDAHGIYDQVQLPEDHGACQAMDTVWGGFFGPYQHVGPSPPSPPSPGRSDCQWKNDTDYDTGGGGGLGAPHDSTSREECCAVCWANPKCAVAVFSGAKANGRCEMPPGRSCCWLKTHAELGRPGIDKGVVSCQPQRESRIKSDDQVAKFATRVLLQAASLISMSGGQGRQNPSDLRGTSACGDDDAALSAAIGSVFTCVALQGAGQCDALGVTIKSDDAAAATVMPVDPMVQIFPWRRTPITQLTAPLAAARGELVHLQAVVQPTGSGEDTTVTASIAALGTVRVRQVGYEALTKTFNADRPTGLYPATLLPAAYAIQQRGAPTVFWLTLRIPRNATPGLHHGTISAVTLGMAAKTSPFSVQVSSWAIPMVPTQLTGAAFGSKYVRGFSPGAALAPETAMNFFESFADQRVNSFAFFELDGQNLPSQGSRVILPWSPTYRFTEDFRRVELNTTMHQEWWPRVLSLTSSTHWRMPFTNRVRKAEHNPSSLPTNSTWDFTGPNGKLVSVPIFAGTGELNPRFQQLFIALFGVVFQYLETQGWDETGTWVQVQDEPAWGDLETLTNIVVLMKLYKSISPKIKIFQTRWPVDGQNPSGALNGTEELLELVDWWCPHIEQWDTDNVPEALKALRARGVTVTVYDNGIPITEAPWERTRFQALDIWTSNGTLDGTLSWYSVNSGRRDPWTTQHWLANCTGCKQWPSGFGVELWPPPPGFRNQTVWAPIETIVWVMLGAGLQDVEYLYALSAREHLLGPPATALLAHARKMARGLPSGWFPHPGGRPDWGDSGYEVDDGEHSDGSGVVNNWKLAMGRALDTVLSPVILATRNTSDSIIESQPLTPLKTEDSGALSWTVQAGDTGLSINISSGALTSVNHKPSRTEFLTGVQQALFTLALVHGGKPSNNTLRNVKSSDFRRIAVVGRSASRLELAFSDHPGAFGHALGLSANATIFTSGTASTPLVHFRLAVDNAGSWAVQSAMYPEIEQRAALGPQTGELDELLFPCAEGQVIPYPGLHVGLRDVGFYPNGCPVQVAARYSARAGLYLSAQDAAGQVKQWALGNEVKQWVRMDLVHHNTEHLGGDFAVGYDTVVGTFGAGGWREAARLYKEWAVASAPWTKTKLTARTDIPSILLSGAPGIISGLRGGKTCQVLPTLGDNLEHLPTFIDSYKARINTSRMLFVPYGWENHGTWAGLNYFPAQPNNQSWVTANRALKAAGDSTMLLVSGYWWVIKRAAGAEGCDLAFDDSGELYGTAAQMLVKEGPLGGNGSIWYANDYNLTVAKQKWRGLSAAMCHGHPVSLITPLLLLHFSTID